MSVKDVPKPHEEPDCGVEKLARLIAEASGGSGAAMAGVDSGRYRLVSWRG
jgi:hypothetical protein